MVGGSVEFVATKLKVSHSIDGTPEEEIQSSLLLAIEIDSNSDRTLLCWLAQIQSLLSSKC